MIKRNKRVFSKTPGVYAPAISPKRTLNTITVSSTNLRNPITQLVDSGLLPRIDRPLNKRLGLPQFEPNQS